MREEWHLKEGRRVSGVEPLLSGPNWALGPFGEFQCVPRLPLTRHRSDGRIKAVAQTPGQLCGRPSRVKLMTLLGKVFVK